MPRKKSSGFGTWFKIGILLAIFQFLLNFAIGTVTVALAGTSFDLGDLLNGEFAGLGVNLVLILLLIFFTIPAQGFIAEKAVDIGRG